MSAMQDLIQKLGEDPGRYLGGSSGQVRLQLKPELLSGLADSFIADNRWRMPLLRSIGHISFSGELAAEIHLSVPHSSNA